MKTHNINRYDSLSNFEKAGRLLSIQKIDVLQLISEFGTPLYVYDSATIAEDFLAVSKFFPKFEIFYSIKANPSLAICSLLRSLGSGAEIASGGELAIAQKAGFDAGRIMYAGPSKTDDELLQAIQAGITSINVESISELMRLEILARNVGKVVKACLRINVRPPHLSSPEIMASGSSKFGIDEEVISKEIQNIQLKMIKLVGLHIYNASQILAINSIVTNFDNALKSAMQIINTNHFPLEILSFGGGFGVPYDEREKNLNIRALGSQISKTLNQYKQLINLEKIRFILELGRYLVARSGIFLTKVIDIKESRGQIFVSTDGGMNHFTRPIFMRVQHPTFVVNKLGMYEKDRIRLGGPLCTPFDIYAEIDAPKIERGDIVGIFNAGAYGFTMSMLRFLSHNAPPEVLIHDNRAILIRSRESNIDLISNQIIPSQLRRF